MSILVRYHPANLTAEKYDENHPKIEEAGFPPEGLQVHVCSGSPEKLTVTEVFESREQMQAWGETVMPLLAGFGIEFEAEPDISEIHNLVKG